MTTIFSFQYSTTFFVSDNCVYLVPYQKIMSSIARPTCTEKTNKQNLLAWLMKQKDKGYYIVGVEQTSSSLPLTEMVFSPDRPTVLLLGKEKEGIPVEFLSAVDQCVEIPQLGIIRSLNVHVSGAITIWEYTKQQLENGKKKNAQ